LFAGNAGLTAKIQWALATAVWVAVSGALLRAPAAAAELAASPDAPTRHELIGAMKELEQSWGFRPTQNFLRRTDHLVADFRCYYTGKLELPDSYEGLEFKQGSKEGCPLDPAKFDVFFYAPEAEASGRTPVTASLQSASLERFLVVVPHEDFHSGKEHDHLPAALTEATSTLMGFLAALELARQQFGPDSEVTRNLAQEPDLFQRKAELVNRYHEELRRVYADRRSGRMKEQEALARKAAFFEEASQDCQAIRPDPRSFSKCLSAGNNAGLAFDATYTKHYPLLYEVFLAYQRDARATVQALQYALSAPSEAEALGRLHARIAAASGANTPRVTEPALGQSLPPATQ
jgi:hypothetical protein